MKEFRVLPVSIGLCAAVLSRRASRNYNKSLKGMLLAGSCEQVSCCCFCSILFFTFCSCDILRSKVVIANLDILYHISMTLYHIPIKTLYHAPIRPFTTYQYDPLPCINVTLYHIPIQTFTTYQCDPLSHTNTNLYHIPMLPFTTYQYDPLPCINVTLYHIPIQTFTTYQCYPLPHINMTLYHASM